MRHKAYALFLTVETALCAALVFVPGFGGEWLLSFLSFPFELVGKLLRLLSLRSRAGDILAWLLCLGLSAAPLWLCIRIRQSRKWMDLLLPLASVLVFCALYLSVNPMLIKRWFGEAAALMGLAPVGGAVYSILLTWAILRLVHRMETLEIWQLGSWLLRTLGAVFVLVAFGSALSGLGQEIAAVRAGNTAAGQPLGLTMVFLVLGYLMEAFSWLLDLWVLFAALSLFNEARADRLGEATVAAAEELYRRARLSLCASLTAALCYDLVQLAVSRKLLSIHTTIRLPVFSVAFLLLMLVLSRLLRENRSLRDDNELII